MMILNSFTVAKRLQFWRATTERPSRFLADEKTFEGICLALSRKFRQLKQLRIVVVFKTILYKKNY